MTRHPPTTEIRIVLRTILSAGVLAVLVLVCAGTAAGATWVVDDDGGAGVDYTTIQAAVDAASAGDTIEVRSGTYVENVDVNKQLTLRGIDTGEGMPVVDAGGIGSAITLIADGITLEGFKATNAGDLWGNAGINIGSSNCLVKDNELFGNRIDGICLIDSSDNIISGNNIHETERWAGIYLHNSSDNVISNNICEDNKYRAIYLFGGSSNNEVINNICKNDDIAGITLYGSLNCAISNNTCENTSTGIYLSYSTGNTITNNNIMENNDGVWLAAASDNRIYHNNLIANTRNAYEYNGVNQWDSGSEGNHYGDDYTGTDSDGDGIGDTPYPIPAGSSVDRYPLMAQYTPPTGPQNKSLVQVEGQPEVYWFQNDRLYWVTDWNVINDMSGVPGWDSVNILPASEFDPTNYPQGPRFVTTGAESDGLLIRQVGDYKVYRIENGKKRHITYPDVMDLKGYSFDDVIEVSSEISDMFPLGDPIGIEVDLYFNKKTDLGDISHVSQFTSGETVKSITETAAVEDYAVETYVRMIKPDGTENYAYYESVDFSITDPLQFSDTERSLYSGIWHAQTKTWNWDEYTFVGDEMEGVYTWEFWYEDVASGKVLGKDVQGYEFTITTPPIEDTTPPFIQIRYSDGDTVYTSPILVSVTVYDSSGIETVTINGQDAVYDFFNNNPFDNCLTYYSILNLHAGLNEITILANDASENHNEKSEKITVIYYPFNVKIASPNDLDRLIPGESINGEVIGGTSPFEYKWIINEVEHFGTSDYIFSESGKYEVELEVTDDEGYSIKTKEKQIIVSHLNVGTTFGFRPNPNGYQFGNFVRDDYSWEMFRNTYGTDQVELNGKPEPRAEAWYEKNGNFRHAGDSGTCFGISASSLVIYQKDDGNNNYISWDLGVDRYSTLPSWHFFPSFVSTPTNWTEYFQPLQNSAAAVSDKEIYKNPVIVYDELKLRMASVWIEDPMIIGMEWMITDVDGTGHAVVPYKIEESADHRTGKVFIYDSKYPGEEGHFISFDLATNVAKNDEYNEGNDLANVRAIKLSSVQKEKTPLRIPNLDSVTSYGHLLYTDAVGRHYGFSDGEFTEEIPDVTHIIHWGQDEYNHFLETYYISGLDLKRELYGIDDGIATVSIFRPNSLVVADVQVSPSSVDELRVPVDGSSVEFISGEGTSSLSLMLDRETTDLARLARMNMSGIESGSTAQLLFSDDLGKVGVVNKGSQKGCTIYLEQIGLNPGSFGSLKPIMIEENSAAWFIPSDWNDLADSPVVVEHDIGNDGTIEYTEILTPPSASSSTATGAPRDTYRTNEDVYAAGSGFTPGTNVDIHVVHDRDWNDGDPIPQDVTDAVETVPVNNGDVGPLLIWNAPLTPGEYDIVIDANQNGDYDAAMDGLDSGSPGFVVVANPPPTPPTDVPALTPAGIIALVGLLCVIGMSRIRRRFN